MSPQEEKALVAAPQQTEHKAVTKFTAEHGKEVGLPSPEAVNYMMSVANLLATSSLITGDMGNTLEKVKANALAKMLVGHELKMQPMEALQDIDIVKGKVFVRYPQLINQLILRGFKWKWVERSNTRAALEVTRPGMEPELFEYTIEDAKMAGLVYGSDSQYVKRPRVMLTARVVSEAYRSTGGRSNVYAPEERSEVLAGEPDDVAQPEPEVKNEFTIGRKSKDPAAAPSEAAVGQGVPMGTEPPPPDGVAGETAEVSSSGKAAAQTAATEPSQSGSIPIQTPDKPKTAEPTSQIPKAKQDDFLRGFLKVTKIPKTHPDLGPALDYLNSLEPLAVLRDPFRAGADLHEYLHGDPIYAERMTKPDLHSFLRILMKLPGNFTLATQLREAAMEEGQVSRIVAEWEEAGMDLNTCSAEDIESAISLLDTGEENPFARSAE